MSSDAWNHRVCRPAGALLLLAALAWPLFFWRLGSWALFDPDEGRYAEIPREMLARGDFVTPTLNGVLYFEKPPLHYWTTALCFRLFGASEATGRLTSALAALVALYLAYLLGRRMFSPRAGLLGAVILATSLLWVVMARNCIIDTLFSVIVFGAGTAWWFWYDGMLQQQKSGHSRPPIGALFAWWVLLGLGLLAKGPAMLILTVTPVLLYLWHTRGLATLRKMHWLPGLLVLLLVAAPWYWRIAALHPDFNTFFWYGQNIARFLGRGANREHVAGPFFFLYLMPGLMFPWAMLVPGAVTGLRRIVPAATRKQQAACYLLACSGFCFLFFSASTGKLITYILPVFPPLAVLLGAYVDDLLTQGRRAWHFGTHLAMALLTATLLVAAVVLGSRLGILLPGVTHLTVQCATGFLLLWALVLGLGWVRRNLAFSVVTLAAGSGLAWCGLILLVSLVAPSRTCRQMTELMKPGLSRQGRMVLYNISYASSLNFYTGHRAVVYGASGELGFGMSQLPPAERAQWFLNNPAQLRDLVAAPTPVYYLVRDETAASQLADQFRGALQIIGCNQKLCVLGNRAALHQPASPLRAPTSPLPAPAHPLRPSATPVHSLPKPS